MKEILVVIISFTPGFSEKNLIKMQVINKNNHIGRIFFIFWLNIIMRPPSTCLFLIRMLECGLIGFGMIYNNIQ